MPATYEVIDPATLDPIGEVPLHQPEDVERAIAAAATVAFGAGRRSGSVGATWDRFRPDRSVITSSV